ncbi:MAG TPA: hypothetical protein VHN79_10725 [Lacunisphaera sp.]|nr:hypothetical protein [Lacunisphaera sp.]
MSSLPKKIILSAGIVLWLAGAAWGMKQMSDYSLTPGVAGAPVSEWPALASARSTSRSTMVIGLHPECPCSRATVEELGAVLLHGGEEIEALLVFADEVPESPARASALYRLASALPRTRLVCDTSGAELQRFNFQTSGETRLYRPDGRLVFRGGITGSRGHVGDNPGRDALLVALRTGDPAPAPLPVFGCAL